MAQPDQLYSVYRTSSGRVVATKRDLADEDAAPENLVHREHHSPDGFEYGYAGSGPADLARSIVWDFLGREPEPRLYQRFKTDHVAKWPSEETKHQISTPEIRAWLDQVLGRGEEG